MSAFASFTQAGTGKTFAVASKTVQNVQQLSPSGTRLVVEWVDGSTYNLDVTEGISTVVAALNS